SPRSETRYAEPPALPERVPDGALLIVPLHHVFGSDELSALSPPVAERIPEPYVAVSADDARELGRADGGRAEVALGDTRVTLAVRVSPTLAHGTLGWPAGLRGLPVVAARTARLRPAAAGDGA